tara:strand:- start:144 stop:614 length:471 start_codon:yes stop_codon:yes gene_type:complete
MNAGAFSQLAKRAPQMPGKAHAVLFHLAASCHVNGFVSQVGQDNIAKRIGCSRSTVCRAIVVLVNAGILEPQGFNTQTGVKQWRIRIPAKPCVNTVEPCVITDDTCVTGGTLPINQLTNNERHKAERHFLSVGREEKEESREDRLQALKDLRLEAS